LGIAVVPGAFSRSQPSAALRFSAYFLTVIENDSSGF